MKTLLGLVGSPRKFGNSEIFVKEIHRCLEGSWDLRLLRLPELDIRPCLACYQCLFGPMKCVQKDDLELVLNELLKADGIVLAAPTYFLGANASLKRLLDRGLSFYAHIEALWAKPAVGVAIAGVEGLEGYTKLMVDSFLKLILADHRGSEVLYGALPGEVLLDEAGRTAAQRLAKALEHGAEPSDAKNLRCPLCGGDTFRYLPCHDPAPSNVQKVRCMTCSSEGTLRWTGTSFVVETVRGEHPLFLTREDAVAHLKWLQSMKHLFLERRDQLKAITRTYKNLGTWVRPSKD
ncbi:MAG: flavodoxin family protein [Desulfosoma sp.]